MNPGLELDRKIAETIFGWTELNEQEGMGTSVRSLWGIESGAIKSLYTGYVRPSPVPRYSTEIGPAWAVVEKMISTQKIITFDWDVKHGFEGKIGWSVTFGGIVLCRFVSTMPHAICIAGLKIFDDQAKK